MPIESEIRDSKSFTPHIAFTISTINPSIDNEKATYLATIINHVSKVHNIDPYLITSILAQESLFKLEAKNCRNGKCHDFGMSQINNMTIKNYRLNKDKLTTCPIYSISSGALVLKDFKDRFEKKEPNTWWTRYNSSDRIKRKKYHKAVCRWYYGSKYCS